AIDADRDDPDQGFLGQPQARDLRPQFQGAAASGETAGRAFAGGGGVGKRYFVVSTPASLMTCPHFAVSLSIKPRKCSGVSPTSSAPWTASFSFTVGSCIPSVAIFFRLAMMAGGVPPGAPMPYQFSASTFGIPTSAVVGTSGAVEARCGAPIAIARSAPALICGNRMGRSRNVICT